MKIDIFVVINSVSTLFILLVIGYIVRKLKFIDEPLSKRISNLIICVAQPFMIISSLLKISYSQENLNTGLLILAIAVASHLIVAIIAFFVTIKFKDPNERKLTEFSILFSNCAFVGYPILKAIFGEIGIFYGSFYVIIFNVVTWTYGMMILGRGRNDIKVNFMKMFLNYGTVPSIIGVILYLLQVKLPIPILSAMDYMGSLCTPLSMLVIGGLIATVPFKKLFCNIKIYYFCLVKLFIVPLIIATLCKLFGLNETMILFAAIMSGLPTAANTGMFAELYDITPTYAAQAVGMSTVFSVVSIPVILYLINFIVK